MTADLTNPIYKDEEAARKHFENVRWPDGPVCPHCGSVKNSTELQGKSTRPGVYKCKDCRKPFSATVGTLFERSHIPLHKWLLAVHLLSSSKKGMSAHQLWRMLGFGSYRTAWFMAHRIREAMRPANPGPMGGGGKTVEVDETYFGPAGEVFDNKANSGRGGWRKKPGTKEKMKVLTLVERGGSARSFHVPDVKSATLRAVLHSQLKHDSHLMTESYRRILVMRVRRQRFEHWV